MPRVLLTGFCAVPGPRRAGVQLRHVVRSLTPFHTVDVLVVREGDQPYVERQGSVRVLRVPTHEADLRGQIQAFQRALKRQLDGADYEVVHCRDSWAGVPVLEARARLGYAVVYDLTRSPLGETTFDGELDAQYGRDEEACIVASDLVLAPTSAAVKALQGRGNSGPSGRSDRIMLSPPGVDVDRFDWDEPAKDGPPRILYAGSIDPGRGVRVLIRAMASIVREIDARLVLAGPITPRFDGPLRDGIRELKLTDKVEMVGAVDHDQIPALIATSTVCVVPSAPDLAPNPTALFPTKLLEYMACRRAIVAPRRETVSMVVENGREALLFEAGDPIDLARKVLRLIDEPVLRERMAQAGYDRVRREFTASAARRYLRTAYGVLTDRFAAQFSSAPIEDDQPKLEMLADDDFEATVFEEAPQVPAIDTAVIEISVADETGTTSSESVVAPPPPPDHTIDRSPLAPPPTRRDRPRPETDGWTQSAVTVPATSEDWVVTSVAQAIDDDESIDIPIDDGTPVEGTRPGATSPLSTENAFVAGEIEVPTPGPLKSERPGQERPDRPAPVEFTAASKLLGNAESDPDTGNRTPALERKTPGTPERRSS